MRKRSLSDEDQANAAANELVTNLVRKVGPLDDNLRAVPSSHSEFLASFLDYLDIQTNSKFTIWCPHLKKGITYQPYMVRADLPLYIGCMDCLYNAAMPPTTPRCVMCGDFVDLKEDPNGILMAQVEYIGVFYVACRDCFKR